MTTEDPMRVPKVDGDEKIKPKPLDPPNAEAKGDPALAAGAFSLWLRKTLGFLDKGSLGVTPSGELKTVLSQIKKFLQELKEDDRTKDPSFTAALSANWRKLLLIFEEMSPKALHYPTISSLINAVEAFPVGEQHRLGFYLTHYAGEEWLPFPYLDILRTLNRDYLVRGLSSDLHLWLHLIDEILGTDS